MFSNHLKIIEYNPRYKTTIDYIQAGIFQNIVIMGDDGVLRTKVNKRIEKQIKIFNDLCSELQPLNNNFEPFYVYRGLFNMPNNITHRIPHPIPFSTTLSEDFAKEWLYGYTEGLIVLRLLITPENNSFVYINVDEEQEVLIPPGDIIITEQYKKQDNITYYSCIFKKINNY
jgi:hypothetical protein